MCDCHGNIVVCSSGSVEVYGGDESSGEWNLSHTLQFTRRQFPGELSYIRMHVSSRPHQCVSILTQNCSIYIDSARTFSWQSITVG